VRLHRAEHAVIDPRKLRGYALSSEHPVGRFKAAFFATLGFTDSHWESFEVQLRKLAALDAAMLGERTAYGQKYVIRGRIVGPTGRSAEVVTVWIFLEGEDAPRFVTVYPET
jgi:hypothetical protein